MTSRSSRGRARAHIHIHRLWNTRVSCMYVRPIVPCGTDLIYHRLLSDDDTDLACKCVCVLRVVNVMGVSLCVESQPRMLLLVFLLVTRESTPMEEDCYDIAFV